MNEQHLLKVSQELNLPVKNVAATALLFAEGATVPFIARYRKEKTGSLDEVQITNIRDRMIQLAELDSRRDAVLKSLAERNLLTDLLKGQVGAATTMSALEDIYQPFKPKRQTRGTKAKERGLEPLADALWAAMENAAFDPTKEAAPFIDEAKEVKTAAEALAGARDILAERINDDANARARLREIFRAKGIIKSKVLTGKEVEGAKFKDYFDWNEPVIDAPSHRILAMRRGETEGFLIMRVQPPEEEALPVLESMFVKGKTPASEQIKLAVQDCYKRLLGLAMETEMRLESKKRADEEGIRVFADNLRELLLASPLGQKSVLGIDPGFRTGCKVVCLDRQGKLLHNDVIYPDQSTRSSEEAFTKLRAFCMHFKIEAIAIGNGTAGRETEAFVRRAGLPAGINIVMVNESGASIYSASEAAREEFPDQDLTVRGAVSIGRRLMDPLAELVKLDPKSIGVGQYQHDVDQPALKRSLDDVVVSCVNKVGVEVNTASKHLLAYVSGIGPQIAGNIIAYRNENGPFKSRKELLKVPRLGDKAYEQAAGFLRIRDGEHPLDGSAVHPESYGIVDRIVQDLNCTLQDLLKDDGLRKRIDLQKYVTDTVGLPTLKDIINELAKPGRDPRKQFEAFSFAEGVNSMADLKPGMKLPGIVTNVTAFGAFVDIGVHQDGLVHISQMSDSFVKNPAEVLKVGQRVHATVMEIDMERKRIGLSLKTNPGPVSRPSGGAPGGNRGPSGGAARPPQPSSLRGNDWFSDALAKGKRN
jgi:uncharacterized protein